jgi:hypothetical protein
MWDPSQFDILGTTRASFAVLAPGASETLRFVVVPKSTGFFSSGPALATYFSGGAGANEAEISGTSNALPRLPILSRLEERATVALKVGAYVSFGFCKTARDWSRGATAFAVVAGAAVLNQCLLAAKRAVLANRRRKAIADLTKDD